MVIWITNFRCRQGHFGHRVVGKYRHPHSRDYVIGGKIMPLRHKRLWIIEMQSTVLGLRDM
jgi:hypothetical protein